MKTTFASRLKQLRTERDLTREEFAGIFGISRTTIWRYENEENTPPIDFVMRVSAAFNVSADWLAGRTDVREISHLLENELLDVFKDMSAEERERVVDFAKFTIQKRSEEK
jgi:transcriptional regulator with XRE-family HTH domain